MPGWMDHVMLFAIVLALPTWGAIRTALLLASPQPERSRPAIYRAAIRTQWALALAVLVVWMVPARPWGPLGLAGPATLPALSASAWVLAGVALVLLLRARAFGNAKALAAKRIRLRRTQGFMPRTSEELRAFLPLAVTAGVCEELVFRGFVTWYLQPIVGTVGAVAIAAALFGLSHAHLGARGVLFTAIVGAWLGGICIMTGSLYVAMAIHVLIDLQAGFFSTAAFAREQQASGSGLPMHRIQII